MSKSRVRLWQVAPVMGLPLWIVDNANAIFGWGWIVVVLLLLRIVWKAYRDLRMAMYVGTIAWTHLQVTVPDDAEQTPTAMEHAFEIWDGLHKGPDLIERYFDGYLEAWYSCEIHCVRGRARYLLVVPTAHRSFFEGVVYGQYPEAEIHEVEDYTRRYRWQDIDKTIDLYGTEMKLTNDDMYPVKTYRAYEDELAADDKFIDPHQALIEAYTNITEDEEFWVQVLVRPIAPPDIQQWEQRGEMEINALAGKVEAPKPGWYNRLADLMLTFPSDVVRAFLEGPLEPRRRNGGPRLTFPIVSASDKARMEAILHKIDRGAYRVKMRVLYLAPYGKLTKPNISRAVGGFKQFNTFNLNGFMPDPNTRTNDPNYIMKVKRRRRRKRNILVLYQQRDFWRYEAGFMMSPEELATLYHFPTKYTRAPAFDRAKAGKGSPPDNVPMAR